MPPARRGAGVQKSTYMTRDAARRLKLAKRAAAAVLASGGPLEAAASAAQQFGTPAGDGSDTEASEGSDGEGDDARGDARDDARDDAQALACAVEAQLAVSGGTGAAPPRDPGGGEGT